MSEFHRCISALRLRSRPNDNLTNIINHWLISRTDDEVLGFVDHATGATLLFYAVQRRPDSEALLLTRYLVQERAVCKVTVRDANLQTPLFFAGEGCLLSLITIEQWHIQLTLRIPMMIK